MGKIVTYIPDPDNPVRLAPGQYARQKRLMEEAGEAYYDEIPVTTTEEFQNGDWFGAEEEAARYAAALDETEAQRAEMRIQLAPSEAAYLHSRGPAFRQQLESMVRARIVEAQQSEQRS